MNVYMTMACNVKNSVVSIVFTKTKIHLTNIKVYLENVIKMR